MPRTPRPRVAGAGRLLHIPRRGNRVPLDVAALSHGDDLLLLLGLAVDDQAVPHTPPLGRRLRGTSGKHERDEQRQCFRYTAARQGSGGATQDRRRYRPGPPRTPWGCRTPPGSWPTPRPPPHPPPAWPPTC